LRTAPVRREEAFFDYRQWRWLTMPLGTYTCKETILGHYLSGDPALWADVVSKITAEHEVERRSRRMFGVSVSIPRLYAAPHFLSSPSGLGFGYTLCRPREFVCEYCGVGFLARGYDNWPRFVCSNHCARQRRIALRRQYKRDNPPSPEAVRLMHAQRTAQRAAARAGRQCAHCGRVIEAARSTRRFCSDICRVKAYREAKGTRQEAL
jgi:hypothetical protein